MSSGIPHDAVAFYAELEADNSKTWWQANRARWEVSVRDPLQAVVDELEEEFGPAKLFRPHRDVRFSHDKSPYKTHQGAVVSTGEGAGFYVQVSADGLLIGAGWYASTPAQLAAYREAVLEDASGEELEEHVAELERAGHDVTGDQLVTAPRGIDKAHPRIRLLRHRTLVLHHHHGEPDWLASDAVGHHVRADWQAYVPLLEWFDDHLPAPSA